MKPILFFCFCVVAVLACNKDKVETKPHISFKSFNTDVVSQNQALRVILNFTDQEGDLDSLLVIRKRLNTNGPSYKILPYGIPEFSGQNKGELQATLSYASDLTVNLSAIPIPGSNPRRYEPDTLQLKFYLKDKAGNVSDSTSPKQVIVIR
jgi:hypothetical protein